MTLLQRPAELLQALIRFDTSNPPGDEADCVIFLRDLLAEAGLATELLAQDPARPNLLVRLPGRNMAPPLLLHGHLDVVGVAGQRWSHPPFDGQVADGFIWGRGALDMKGGVAMLVAAVARAHQVGLQPAGDILLALMPDEERGSTLGARFLVEEHAGRFAGVRYAIGEFGGFSIRVAGRRCYPIMVAEKQCLVLRATVRGPAGHGATPLQGGAMARLGRLLAALDGARLPAHVTPAARLMIEGLLRAYPPPLRPLIGQLLNPRLADRVLAALGPQGRLLAPMLRNTVSPTMLHASDQINVIPAVVSVDLDARLLPGLTPAHLLAELASVVGDEVALEVYGFEPTPDRIDMGLYGTLADVLRAFDPAGLPTPLLLNGVTDGRFFARLGIQTYGFLPMQLPDSLDLFGTIHGADERIPVAALDFGTAALSEVLRRYR